MLPQISPEYFKKTQASKLGMPKASSSSSTNYQVIYSETIFSFLHIICVFLERLCVLFSVLFLFSSLVITTWTQNSLLEERHASLFHQSTPILHLYLLSIHILRYSAFSSCFHVFLVRAISYFVENTLLLHLYLFGELLK